MKLISILLIMLSCSTPKIGSGYDKQSSQADINTKQFEYELSSYEVYNGKVKFISFKVDLDDGAHKIKCTEQGSKKPLVKSYPFYVRNEHASFYYAENYHSQAKEHFCYLKNNHVLTIKVKQFPYKKEFLKVAKGKVVLSKKNKARASREWHLKQKIFKKAIKSPLIDSAFKVPLNSFITSHYGKRRIFNNLKKTQHLGNDFRAKVGLPIPVSNKGKVVYTGNLFYTGNVVIVDHGMDLFTYYAHLSKIIVKTGTHISKGDIVGLSGSTGRVSGPHLHWGVRLHGYNIDGFSLVDESSKQYSENVLAK